MDNERVMTAATEFGPLLRHARHRAGLGLRTFAMLMEERASTVSAIESGQRGPWRLDSQLRRAASLLGIDRQSPAWDKLRRAAHGGLQKGDENRLPDRPEEGRAQKVPGPLFQPPCTDQSGRWQLLWWLAEDRAQLSLDLSALANFLGLSVPESMDESATADSIESIEVRLTDLEIESRVRHLLGRRTAQLATAPVDVESVLEIPSFPHQTGVRLEIIPGLLPRFSVQAALVASEERLTVVVDRIVADSRPIASYRLLLARCYAPRALGLLSAGEYRGLTAPFSRLRESDAWPRIAAACDRFALALLLPASPFAAAAASVYAEIVEQHDPSRGWPALGPVMRQLRNRLAEQFDVPPNMAARRLVGWPCHFAERVARALAAEEPRLPPADWIESPPQKQRTLFAL
jgi:transcriptional regulator with XRE-family HTH domain